MDKFLVMWCSTGLETLINLSFHERENIISVLKEEPYVWKNPIREMILRARFNSQRFYEIYVFESEIDENTIRELFLTEPQVIVDAIRRVGNQLYSDRKTAKDVIT